MNSIKFHPHGKIVDAKGKPTILELAQTAGVDIETECAGLGVCGSCQVKVLSGEEYLSKMDEDEKETVAFFSIPAQNRLACKAQVEGSVEVEVL